MKIITYTASAVLLALGLTGCATVTRGENTAWEVNTTPPGAHVKTSNGFYCDSTPCSIRMPRRSEFTATITKDGYQPLQVGVTHHIAAEGGAAMAGNALIGGLIGAGVDVATGATLDLSPNPVTVTLEKDASPPVATAAPTPAAAPPPVAVTTTPAPPQAPVAAPTHPAT